MKKILLVIFGCFLSFQVSAGIYDGVWEYSGFPRISDDYVMMRQNGSQFLIVGLCSELDCWDASLGPITGNHAEVDLFAEIDDWSGHFSIEFTSETTAIVIIKSFSCNGCENENFLNTPINMKKVF